MRVISGEFGGRTINGSPGKHVRPTTDRAKEALFNKLCHDLNFNNIEVLDLFAGSGSLALECLSRGALHVTSVDFNKHSVSFMKNLRKDWSISQDSWTILQSDVAKFLKKNPLLNVDLILLDPPYHFPELPAILTKILNSTFIGTSIVVEHPGALSLPQYNLNQKRSYGQSSFSFYHGTLEKHF